MADFFPELPPGYADTRDKLHLVAARVLGTARYQAVGRIGLEVAPGGFATPDFDGRRLVVAGDTLGDGERHHRLSTLGEACEFAGVDLVAATHPVLELPADASTDVSVDEAAAVIVADWYALCQDVLERFAAACEPADAASAITLWPEHFDVALSAGAGPTQANYGGSPGDSAIDEPYLYVGPFSHRDGEFWNVAFGAALTCGEVRGGADPLAFLLGGQRALRESV